RRQPHVAAVGLRQRLQKRARFGLHLRRIDVHLAQDRRDDAALLIDECDQQVLGRDLGVVLIAGEVLRPDNRFLCFLGVLVEIHCLTQRCSSSRRLRSNAEALRSVLVPQMSVAWATARRRGRTSRPSRRVCPPSACRIPLTGTLGRSVSWAGCEAALACPTTS